MVMIETDYWKFRLYCIFLSNHLIFYKALFVLIDQEVTQFHKVIPDQHHIHFISVSMKSIYIYIALVYG